MKIDYDPKTGKPLYVHHKGRKWPFDLLYRAAKGAVEAAEESQEAIDEWAQKLSEEVSKLND